MKKNYKKAYTALNISFDSKEAKLALKHLLNCGNYTVFKDGPTLSQCVGTKRMWGSALGRAFAHDANNLNQGQIYEKIAFYSRSYAVIQDYLMDEDVSRINSRVSEKYLKILTDEICELIKKVGGNPREFDLQVQNSWKAYMRRQQSNMNIDLLGNAKDKIQVFFNPYGLKSILRDRNIRARRMLFLNTYFDICQILDDYQDLNEDINKKVNHNLFLSNGSKSQQKNIIANKKHIAPHVIEHCILLLKSVKKYTKNNPIFNYYYKHSVDWLKMMKKELIKVGLRKAKKVKWINNPPYVREISKVSKISNNKFKIKSLLNKIRPEFLQTQFIGIQNISNL